MRPMSEISETWVPPQGHPGLSAILTMRGVLSCQSLCISITEKITCQMQDLFLHFV